MLLVRSGLHVANPIAELRSLERVLERLQAWSDQWPAVVEALHVLPWMYLSWNGKPYNGEADASLEPFTYGTVQEVVRTPPLQIRSVERLDVQPYPIAVAVVLDHGIAGRHRSGEAVLSEAATECPGIGAR